MKNQLSAKKFFYHPPTFLSIFFLIKIRNFVGWGGRGGYTFRNQLSLTTLFSILPVAFINFSVYKYG